MPWRREGARPNATLSLRCKVIDLTQRDWKIKLNESKSTYLTLTLRNDPSPPMYFNNVEIPPGTTVRYLGLHLDHKLTWKEHISKKRKQMDLRQKNAIGYSEGHLTSQETTNSCCTNPSLLLYGHMA